MLSRRFWLLSLGASAALRALQRPETPEAADNKDWTCPMDADVRSAKAGVCPRCGMKLVLHIPERVEYPLEVVCEPRKALAKKPLELTLRVRNPETNQIQTQFDLIHEKLIHLFVVSENLEFFAHVHPEPQKDGTFKLGIELPYGGMYRLLADFYPTGGTPQLAVDTLYLTGTPGPPIHLAPSLAPVKAANLTATLRTEPEQPLAGMENRLTYSLNPSDDLQLYLGTWGHMLAASSDLIDLMHVHPFLVKGGDIQFNVIFPRPGLYRIWTQFQRDGVVDTAMFTVPVKAI